MITNFDGFIDELNEEEKKLIPILVQGFKNHSKENPIKASEIITAINSKADIFRLKNKFSEPRLRKICNHIRTNGLLPLIATSVGYYVSYDKEEIANQIKSLLERANSIKNSANGLKKFI